MNFDKTYNARFVPISDVASTFIPPEPHFSRLISRGHTIIRGPRGSGKTTLLKMLTVRALSRWQHPKSPGYVEQIRFNAAFIPADVTWEKQLGALSEVFQAPQIQESAFSIHTVRSLIYAMREAVELAKGNFPHMSHLAVSLTAQQEGQFANAAASLLELKLDLPTLLSVEQSLDLKLHEVTTGQIAEKFAIVGLPTTLSFLVNAFNRISGHDDRVWALLFDELEIAPRSIRDFLLSSLRSFSQNIIYKLAVAPFMSESGITLSPTSASVNHDFNLVTLYYGEKRDALFFTEQMVRNMFQKVGIEANQIKKLFDLPEEFSEFGRRVSTKAASRSLPSSFIQLMQKDESFRRYVDSRKLLDPEYIFTETNVAKDIRKVFPIVLLRNYYIKSRDGDEGSFRSRKSSLYLGYSTLMDVTEGNPRAVLTLMGPLIEDFKLRLERGQATTIEPELQLRALQRVEVLLTSLLRVYPLGLAGYDPSLGLLALVDRIGYALEQRVLKQEFRADYIGTFVLDDKLSPDLIKAVGRALNTGAIIHVETDGDEAALDSLVSKKYRLSYALARRYRILLTLGASVSLSTLLQEQFSGSSRQIGQLSLFEDGVSHD